MELVNTSTFCIAPFIHQSTKTDGSIKLCCRSLPEIENLSNSTLADAWNNDEIKKVRTDLVNGIKNSRCNICWNHEKNHVQSLRQKYNFSNPKNFRINDIMDETGHVNTGVKWLELKLNNICNFSCRMCHPMDSTSWFKDWKHISNKFYDENWQNKMIGLGLTKKAYLGVKENFLDTLDLSKIEKLSFAGGEPLFDKMHYEVLERVLDRSDHISLEYATNLSMLKLGKYDVISYWKQFKSVEVSVSLDGPREKNDYIRNGADWYVIETNIKRLIQELPNVRINGKFTLQNTNIYYLPETVDWFKDMKINYDVAYLSFPECLDSRIIPPNFKIIIKEKLMDAYKKTNSRVFLDSINYMMGKDLYNKVIWDKFYDYHLTLDKVRNQSLFDTFPIHKQFKNE